MKTLFHSKKLNLHIWVAGSRREPYSHIYISGRRPFMFNYNGKDHFYEHAKKYYSLNIFPYCSRQACSRWDESLEKHVTYHYWRYGISNGIPKWVQKIAKFIDEVNNRAIQFWPAPDEEPEPIPSWIAYAWFLLKSRYKQKHCKHELEVDSMINGDTGQEWFYCPKCGWGDHVIWY